MAATEQQSLISVLEQLRSDGVQIIYTTDLVSSDMEVSGDLSEEDKLDDLKMMLNHFQLDLKAVKENTYLVVRLVGQPPLTGSAAGKVTNEWGQPISTARIYGSDSRLLASSDIDGQFRIAILVAGTHDLRIESDRYQTLLTEIEVNADETTSLSFSLMAVNEMENIVVQSSRYKLFGQMAQTVNRVDSAEFDQQALLGNDAFRVANRLPGSASIGLSARPKIRGGRDDEVLVLYDDVRLYEPFHLKDYKSVFSSLSARTIDSIDFYSGGFPVQYGDRLSAVMDIAPKIPDAHGMTELGVGLFNLSLLKFESYPETGREWLVSVRRSSIDLISGVFESDFGKPSYTDAFGRFSTDLSDHANLSINLMFAGDKITINNSSNTEHARTLYSNSYFWTKLVQDWSEDLYSSTLFSLTTINNDRSGSVDQAGVVIGSLDDDREFRMFSLKQDWQYLPSDTFLNRFGWEVRYLMGEYEYSSHLETDPVFAELNDLPAITNRLAFIDEHGEQFSLYYSSLVRTGSKFTWEIGIRWDAQDIADAGYEDQWSPRLSLLYRLSPETEIRASWGAYYQSQGIHELKVEDGVNEFDTPERSEHFVTSLNHLFANGLSLRLEAYTKRISEATLYFDNLYNPNNLLPELQPDRIAIDPRRSEANGFELVLAGNADKEFSWWINYSQARVEDDVAGISVRRSWDQSDSANFGLKWLRNDWTLTFNGTYHTGWPSTRIFLESRSDNGGNPTYVAVSGKRNRIRFSHYSSLDVKAIREVPLSRGKLRMEFGLTNLLNRDNQAGVEYLTQQDDSGASRLVEHRKYAISIVPLIDFFWVF